MVKFAGDRLYAGVHRVVGPPGEQASMPRHSVGYFCRPNSDVKLQSLFDGEAEDGAMTADEWIAHRTRNRATANYRGPETVRASRGMEHFAEGGKRRDSKLDETESVRAAASEQPG